MQVTNLPYATLSTVSQDLQMLHKMPSLRFPANLQAAGNDPGLPVLYFAEEHKPIILYHFQLLVFFYFNIVNYCRFECSFSTTSTVLGINTLSNSMQAANALLPIDLTVYSLPSTFIDDGMIIRPWYVELSSFWQLPLLPWLQGRERNISRQHILLHHRPDHPSLLCRRLQHLSDFLLYHKAQPACRPVFAFSRLHSHLLVLLSSDLQLLPTYNKTTSASPTALPAIVFFCGTYW